MFVEAQQRHFAEVKRGEGLLEFALGVVPENDAVAFLVKLVAKRFSHPFGFHNAPYQMRVTAQASRTGSALTSGTFSAWA